MTLDELKRDWDEAYAIIKRERAWRWRVFAKNPKLRREKLEEIDRLTAIVTGWKDELKPHCEPTYEQPALLDVPKKDVYP